MNSLLSLLPQDFLMASRPGLRTAGHIRLETAKVTWK
jgi:hypothetical protein